MQRKELVQLIERAEQEGATRLDLTGRGLTALPPEIGQLTSLASLDLMSNQLTALPPEIGQLTSLTSLNLSSNKLTVLPPEIGQLTSLIELLLIDNELTELPPEIGRLTNLRAFHPKINKLTTFPLEIGQLVNLRLLEAGGNPFSEFPLMICQLTNLEKLYLYESELTTLPSDIGRLIRLRQLSLYLSKLTKLPPEIGQLTSLTSLDLSLNQLTALPPEIGQLTNLTSLDLRGNSLPIPPEILEKTDEPTTIINYYLQHLVGERKSLNEAKMLLVGQGSVGKTSLVRRLVEGRFDPQESKTQGIDIRQWQVAVDGHDVRLNVWDFGGQEIMHATHQFFLTRRSLYLLVLDARLEEEENRLEYWLKIIQSFGGDSPVIVVGNKTDQHPLDVDRRGLRAKYPSIKAFVETSCATGAGIEALRAAITREVGALEHVHDELLNNWFTVKTRLEEMEEDYLPYTEYAGMCAQEGITDPVSQRTLVGFLHDLGIVLNFQDDPRLEDTNILNPEWVTNGVYKILNSNALFQSRGVLEREQLNEILDSEEYPRPKHMFIMDMMRKFELCFPFEGYPDQRFLVPDLLSKEQVYTGEWDGALAFQYHYNVLPSSIISRFIVRMHPYIHQQTYWRTGVLLAHEGNEALVRADIVDKKIFIWIRGPERTRRTFLTMIRAQFDSIHKTISHIEAEEKVPLPNHPEVAVDYEHLITLEALGKTSFIPEGLSEEVNIKQLLDGVEPEQKRRERRESRPEEKDTRVKPLPVAPPEPVDERDMEVSRELTKIKTSLDQNATSSIRRRIGLLLCALVVTWIGLAIATQVFGWWDTLEPWAFFVPVLVPVAGYAYFVVTEKELNPKTIYAQIVRKKQESLYRESGFDLEKFEGLIGH